MRREFSAGGVLVRRLRGRWCLAAIRPGGKPEGVWALPKGLIGAGERPEETALREVAEETGRRGEPRREARRRPLRLHLGRRARLQGRQLLPPPLPRGRLGDLLPAVAHEVAEARWLPLEEAPRLLAYKGEREMAETAPLASVHDRAL